MMELQAQEIVMGGGLAILIIDRFIQYAKIVKFNLDKKNGNGKVHTEPCISLQTLEGRVRTQNEKYIEERGEMQADIREIKTDVKWMKTKLENGVKFASKE